MRSGAAARRGGRDRRRILSLLRERAASTTELAQALGQPKGTVGHHVKVTEDAQLIRVVHAEGPRPHREVLRPARAPLPHRCGRLRTARHRGVRRADAPAGRGRGRAGRGQGRRSVEPRRRPCPRGRRRRPRLRAAARGFRSDFQSQDQDDERVFGFVSPRSTRPILRDLEEAEEGVRVWPRGGLWRHGDFLKLWSAETISQFGSQITGPLPLVAIITLDVSAFQVSALFVIELAPFLLISLPAGVWVDRRAETDPDPRRHRPRGASSQLSSRVCVRRADDLAAL